MSSLGEKGFAKIVVPVDGSEMSMRAADRAIGIAKTYGAQLVVLYVVNIDQYIQSIGVYRLSYPDPIKKHIDEAKEQGAKWFAEIQKKAEQNGVKAAKFEAIDTALSVVGAIVNFVEQEKAGLVVIGTRGRSGFAKLLLGSVASGVVTYAPCDVLVTK